MASWTPQEATAGSSFTPGDYRYGSAPLTPAGVSFQRRPQLHQESAPSAAGFTSPTVFSPAAYSGSTLPEDYSIQRASHLVASDGRGAANQPPFYHPSQFPHYQSSMPPPSERSSQSRLSAHQNSWPGPPIRRSSSEDARGRPSSSGYPANDGRWYSESPQQVHVPQTRRPSNRDEFDGPSQLLNKPGDQGYEVRDEDLPRLPITLHAHEQDDFLGKVNDRLSQCAFDFIAKYQFPIPVEPDKRPVRVPADREWSEWVYLLKRLATKRRIPARILYGGQIKQFITILENSLEMRHAAKHQSRPLKDDRNVLQLISSGIQVARILKDATAMRFLDELYVQAERLTRSRRPLV